MGWTLCSVKGCKSKRVPGIPSDVSFHRLPKTEFRSQWEAVLDPKFKGKNQRVCSLHFPRIAYNNSRTKSLRWNAVPSLYVPALHDDDDKLAALLHATASSHEPMDVPIEGVSRSHINLVFESTVSENSTTSASGDVSSKLDGAWSEHDYCSVSVLSAQTLPQPLDHSCMEVETSPGTSEPIIPVCVDLGETRETTSLKRKNEYVIRLPKVLPHQKTPLVTKLMQSVFDLQRRARNYKNLYKKKCKEVNTLKRRRDEDPLLSIKGKVSHSLYKILQLQLQNINQKPQATVHTMPQSQMYDAEVESVFLGLQKHGPLLKLTNAGK